MTRKDYILLAEALRITLRREIDLTGENGASAGGVRLAASEIADSLARDNSRFDKEHFLAVVRREKDLHSRPVRHS
jgi:hypothetical protein